LSVLVSVCGIEGLTIDCAGVSSEFTSSSAISYNVIAIVCKDISRTFNILFVFTTYSDDTHALYHAVPVLDLCICASSW